MTRSGPIKQPLANLETTTPLPDNWLLARLVRHRRALFVCVALLLAATFNGQWRIGRDSASYRGIARHLARDGHYVFRPKPLQLSKIEDKQDVMYPGLPVLLAALERAFGPRAADALRPVVPLALISVMAAAALVLAYRLIRLAFAPWVAVAVVVGMGTNKLFVEHANELMSDVPFLLGVVAALYGYERLRRAGSGRARAVALAWMIAGTVLAASMRPTFWFLAAAWGVACLWGLLSPEQVGDESRPRRSPYVIALLSLAGLGLLFFIADPRTRGFNPLGGGYETHAVGQLSHLARRLDALAASAWRVSEEHLPVAFFGTKLGRYVSSAYAIMVVLAGVALARRNLLWGLLVLFTVGGTVLLGSNTRYYLMVLPLLLAGWCAYCEAVANWFDPRRRLAAGRALGALQRWPRMPGLAMLFGLGLVVFPNLLATLDLVREQRGLDRHLHYVGFEQAYDAGKMVPVLGLGRMLAASVKPTDRVVGPEATILTYLADRQVYAVGRVMPAHQRGRADVFAKLGFNYVIFPPPGVPLEATVYQGKDPVSIQILNSGLIRPAAEVARSVDGYRLCEFTLKTGPPKHLGTHHVHRRRTTSPATTPATVPLAIPSATTQP